MTTITVPREVLEQALEALETASSCVDGYYVPPGKMYIPQVEDAMSALTAALAQQAEPSGWRPIETAPKTEPDGHALAIILGFAPDEEGYALPSIEGAWNTVLQRWTSTLDPAWANSPQPTHWQPLPTPPESSNDN